MLYITTTTINEYTTEAAAEAARDRAAEAFPAMAERLAVEDTSEPWICRNSWGVALRNGSNEELTELWYFLCA